MALLALLKRATPVARERYRRHSPIARERVSIGRAKKFSHV